MAGASTAAHRWSSRRRWARGALCIADTSFVHSTINESPTDSYRDVLHFSVWHPDLTAEERRGILNMHEALRAYEEDVASLAPAPALAL